MKKGPVEWAELSIANRDAIQRRARQLAWEREKKAMARRAAPIENPPAYPNAELWRGAGMTFVQRKCASPDCQAATINRSGRCGDHNHGPGTA
jgi:hypothetical protein